VTRQVTGSGYHDHNWGNVAPANLFDNWWWGRGRIGGYTIVAADIHGNAAVGGTRIPLFFVGDEHQAQVAWNGGDRHPRSWSIIGRGAGRQSNRDQHHDDEARPRGPREGHPLTGRVRPVAGGPVLAQRASDRRFVRAHLGPHHRRGEVAAVVSELEGRAYRRRRRAQRRHRVSLVDVRPAAREQPVPTCERRLEGSVCLSG
jgi:hypothetical protein